MKTFERLLKGLSETFEKLSKVLGQGLGQGLRQGRGQGLGQGRGQGLGQGHGQGLGQGLGPVAKTPASPQGPYKALKSLITLLRAL